MEEIIEQYLLRKKYCPLPAVGTLEINMKPAQAIFSEHRMHAPVPEITLLRKELPADHFIQFIAAEKNISIAEASQSLEAYCSMLQHLDVYREVKLEHAGKFFVNADGVLKFRQKEIPSEFIPDVKLERVIHPNSVHQVRVGDTETTNVAMAEYYSVSGTLRKATWWIWALLLALAGIAAIALYTQRAGYNNLFGNEAPVAPAVTSNTYQTVN